MERTLNIACNPNEWTDFILFFRKTNEKGASILESVFVPSKMVGLGLGLKNYADYDDIFLVNFKKIRARVDEALAWSGNPRDAFTTSDIQKKFNIKRDRLKEWIMSGFIEPEVEKAIGQGTKNLFSLYDLYLIKLFEHLLDLGFKRAVVAETIKTLKPMISPPNTAIALDRASKQK